MRLYTLVEASWTNSTLAKSASRTTAINNVMNGAFERSVIRRIALLARLCWCTSEWAREWECGIVRWVMKTHVFKLVYYYFFLSLLSSSVPPSPCRIFVPLANMKSYPIDVKRTLTHTTHIKSLLWWRWWRWRVKKTFHYLFILFFFRCSLALSVSVFASHVHEINDEWYGQ